MTSFLAGIHGLYFRPHIWARICRAGKRCELCLKKLFLKLYCDQTVYFFQDFLNSFCALESKNTIGDGGSTAL